MAIAITPFLWFDGRLDEAVELYTETFEGTRVLERQRYPENAPVSPGATMSVTIELAGNVLTLFDGGPGHPQTEAFSLMVRCDTQDEVDRYWERLTGAGGAESMCGWLLDPFGVSWQIVPARLTALLQHPDPAAARRVMTAMLGMRKLDVAALEAAAAG